MTPIAVTIGRSVCSVTEAALGFTALCTGTSNLGLVGALAIFGTIVLAGGYVLVHRI